MANPTNALAIIGNLKISTIAKESKFAGQEFGAGIAAPFPVIGYKGGKWSIRHRGTNTMLMRKDAQGRDEGPLPFLELVALHVASNHSKTYYAKAYKDGDEEVPDCWSTNGLAPDAAAPNKQNPTCKDCKWNAFGSRTNVATGAKGKACADYRRMAVVPYKDLRNTIMGGSPMLLRVPPASLGAVGEFSDLLKANSVPYYAIAIRVGFEAQLAYPKLTFEPYAALTDDEMRIVLEMQQHPLVERIVQAQVENIVDRPGAEEGVETPSAASVNQGASTASPKPDQDDLTPPAHLQRTKPNGVTNPVTVTESNHTTNMAGNVAGPAAAVQTQTAPPPSEPIQQGGNAPAATPAPAEQALTPEQLRIKELEAKLAAAEAGKKPKKARSQPVAPQSTAEPANSQQVSMAFGAGQKTEAEIAAGLPGETIVGGDGEEDGSGSGATVPNDPVLESVSARLSKMLG